VSSCRRQLYNPFSADAPLLDAKCFPRHPDRLCDHVRRSTRSGEKSRRIPVAEGKNSETAGAAAAMDPARRLGGHCLAQAPTR
jgi:hypothetical protein